MHYLLTGIPIVVAHGFLGPNDEVFLPVIGGAFVGLLIITWLSSRKPEDDPDDEANSAPPSDFAVPDIQSPITPTAPEDDPAHYRLN